MLFHLLKFMVWVYYSSESPKRRHFCRGFTVSHQAWAFAVHFPVIIWAPEKKAKQNGFQVLL